MTDVQNARKAIVAALTENKGKLSPTALERALKDRFDSRTLSGALQPLLEDGEVLIDSDRHLVLSKRVKQAA